MTLFASSLISVRKIATSSNENLYKSLWLLSLWKIEMLELFLAWWLKERPPRTVNFTRLDTNKLKLRGRWKIIELKNNNS